MPKKRADGRYQRTIRYTDDTGCKSRKVVYGTTIAELNAAEDAFKAQLAAGQRIGAGDVTVTEWAEEWRKVYKDPHVGPKALEGYKRDLQLITDAIGYVPLKQVRQSDLQRIVNARAGLSGSAIRKTAMTIRALFKAAAVNRMLPFNPADGLQLPRQKDGTHRALTRQEIDAITAAAGALDIRTHKPHRFITPVMLMLYAGLRRGEAAAFDISRDVDLATGTLTVSRSVSYATNAPVLKSTKSAAGHRTLPIFPPLRPYLEAGSGLATRSASGKGGKLISLQAFRLAFQDFMQLAGVDCTPHDLRHTFFTILYDAGVDVKTAQRWGGHATAAVTMEIYTHLSNERESASAALVNNYFTRQSDSQIDSQERIT